MFLPFYQMAIGTISKLVDTNVEVPDFFPFGRCFLGDPCLVKRGSCLGVMDRELDLSVKIRGRSHFWAGGKQKHAKSGRFRQMLCSGLKKRKQKVISRQELFKKFLLG